MTQGWIFQSEDAVETADFINFSATFFGEYFYYITNDRPYKFSGTALRLSGDCNYFETYNSYGNNNNYYYYVELC